MECTSEVPPPISAFRNIYEDTSLWEAFNWQLILALISAFPFGTFSFGVSFFKKKMSFTLNIIIWRERVSSEWVNEDITA